MPTNRAKKCPPTGHRKNGRKKSIAQAAQQKLTVQYFIAANLRSCFKNQSLTFNPDYSWAKTSFMALRCTSVLPAKSGSRLFNCLTIAGSFCEVRKTHWMPIIYFESWLYP